MFASTQAEASASQRPAVSERKRRANRRNARRSTGPRSDEGKLRSAQNAITHGLCSQQLVLPGEDHAAAEQFRLAMLDDLRPFGPMQQMLAERIVSLAWRLQRIGDAEARVHEDVVRFPDTPTRKLGEQLYSALKGDSTVKHLAKLMQSYWKETKAMEPNEVSVSRTLACSMQESDGGPFARIGRYEQRLHTMLMRSMAELRTMQKEEGEQECDEDGSDDLFLTPSPATPGEGWGEGSPDDHHSADNVNHAEPTPSPLPEYRARDEDDSVTTITTLEDPTVQNEPTAEDPVASPASPVTCEDPPQRIEIVMPTVEPVTLRDRPEADPAPAG